MKRSVATLVPGKLVVRRKEEPLGRREVVLQDTILQTKLKTILH